ncbi:MAG TPA: SGNH/GDSL hydrolase family protein, partial [Solirubrobacteraceae bacterium]|nr:SGNH/GDSL hydrolase family protein [Solirubrobacteraceae bacterium]
AQSPGLEAGGAGFIPASSDFWHFNAKTLPVGRTPAPNVWLLLGVLGSGTDGLSGYSAIARSHQAAASIPVDGSSIGVLFTRTAGSGVFSVNAGGKTYPIDAHTSGRPAVAAQWITVPAGTKTIVVHGPRSGRLTFDGVIVRRPPVAGRIGVEVENLGHTGHYLGQDSAPRIAAAIRAQRFDISLFLGVYRREFDAAVGNAGQHESAYAAELRARVRLVRSAGGACVIADPTPLPVPASISARFAEIDRQLAQAEGCAYTAALAHLWNPATAVATGVTIVDGIHPSGAGYRLMAQALDPLLAGLVQARAAGR